MTAGVLIIQDEGPLTLLLRYSLEVEGERPKGDQTIFATSGSRGKG